MIKNLYFIDVNEKISRNCSPVFDNIRINIGEIQSFDCKRLQSEITTLYLFYSLFD